MLRLMTDKGEFSGTFNACFKWLKEQRPATAKVFVRDCEFDVETTFDAETSSTMLWRDSLAHAIHLDDDVNEFLPMNEMPFWRWLTERQGGSGVFLEMLREYLCVGNEANGFLNESMLTCYKHCFNHFWWTKLREKH